MADTNQMDPESEGLGIEQILEATTLDGWGKVYFIGPYGRRLSFASQQNRALNLVWALTQHSNLDDRLRPGLRVAVVGGGIAGLTSCAALLASDCIVSLFESKMGPLERQRASDHRYIHPTVNYWPFVLPNPTTILPFLDWYSERCNKVLSRMGAEWDSRVLKHLNHPYWGTTVSKLKPEGGKIFVEGWTVEGGRKKKLESKAPYDLVLVTAGFEEEYSVRTYGTKSYWENDNFTASNRPDDIVVSGSGDGGLIEALRLVHREFEGGEFIVKTAERVPTAIAALAKHAERAGRSVGSDASAANLMDDLYSKLVADFPPDLEDFLMGSLLVREAAPVLLVSELPKPFGKYSAPIHKLLMAHALARGAVKHRKGLLKRGGRRTIVEFSDGGAPLVCGKNRVVARHGAPTSLDTFLSEEDHTLLKNKQLALMDYQGKRLWPYRHFQLKGYPPHDPKDKDFIHEHLKLADHVLRRYSGVGGVQQVHNPNGYEYSVENSAAITAHIPDHLFGIRLKPAPVSQIVEDYSGPMLQRSATSRPLGIGDRVAPEGADRSGTLGAILVGKRGQFFGLTARHVFARSAGRRILDAAGRFIGRPDLKPLPRSERRSIGEALCIFQLPDDIPLSARCAYHMQVQGIVAPVDALGLLVNKIGGVSGSTQGVVRAIACQIRKRDDNGNVSVYEGAIEVIDSDAGPFAVSGDSGSLVVDGQARAVGIVVGGVEGRTFLAPIEALLQLKTKRFAELDDVTRARAKAKVPALLDAISAGLLDFPAGEDAAVQ